MYYVHYLLRRPTDAAPVRHVLNEVPGATPKEAEANARKAVEARGGTYVSTVKIVDDGRDPSDKIEMRGAVSVGAPSGPRKATYNAVLRAGKAAFPGAERIIAVSAKRAFFSRRQSVAIDPTEADLLGWKEGGNRLDSASTPALAKRPPVEVESFIYRLTGGKLKPDVPT